LLEPEKNYKDGSLGLDFDSGGQFWLNDFLLPPGSMIKLHIHKVPLALLSQIP